MTYDEQVERLRSFADVCGGVIDEKNFSPEGRPPYRYCDLVLETHPSNAPRLARQFAEIAVEVVGYFTMNVHTPIIDSCRLSIAVSRNLTPEEIEIGNFVDA